MVFTTPPARSQQESSPEAILLPIILIGYSIVKYIMTIDSFNNEKIVDESCIDSKLTPSNICPNHNREITKGRPNKTKA